jgi:intracellular sulfur oxidation DsrE/DsrF family protein
MSDSTTRRSFFSRLTASVAALGLGTGTAAAQTASGDFKPTRHPEDDWLDKLPGQHRCFLDAVSPRGAGEAMRYASNVFTASKDGYKLGDADTAIVICLRHQATPFAWNDAIWAKYGATITGEIKFNDPKTGKAAVVNMYNTTGYGEALENRNITFDALAKRGVHFAVCMLSTRRHSGVIARVSGGSADEIYKELTSNLIPNAHLVPAGVVAINRSQERGYSLQYVG